MAHHRKDRYGYHNYYGGRSPAPVVKVLVVVLAVVVTALILYALWLQKYMVYSSSGGKLVMPGTTQSSAVDTSASSGSDSGGSGSMDTVVIDDGASSSSGASSAQAQTQDGQTVTAVEVSVDDLLAGKAQQEMEDAGANAVILTMKNGKGELSYVSELAMAQKLEVSADADDDGNDAVADAITELKSEGVYLIAYMDCFEDDALGAKKDYAILTNSGYRWRGPNDKLRWASPTNEDVRQYLADVAGEIAALGFDEILLDNAGYPTEGNLNYIKENDDYNSDDFESVITGFYSQLKEAVSASGTALGVVSDADTLTDGTNALSGQSLTAIAADMSRVWVSADDASDEDTAQQLQNQLTGAGLASGSLGVLEEKVDTDLAVSQAVLASS